MVDLGNRRFRFGFAAAVVAALAAALVLDVTRGGGDRPQRPDADRAPSQPTGGAIADGELPPDLEQSLAGEPPRARSAQQVAEQIVVAERAIADPETPGRVLAAAGHLQQVAYRVLGARPRWDDDVVAVVPESLRPTVRDNVESRRAFRAMHRTLSDTLPAWRIVPPPRAAELRKHYRSAEATFGVDWEYLAAINLVETGMGRIRGTSVAGAQGPMQFMPGTWARWGRGDVNDPRDAIMAAGRYLQAMGFGRDPDRALFRYNNDIRYVRGVRLIAERIKDRPRSYVGYYHWQVYFLSTEGDILLPQGYSRERPIKVTEWLERTGREAARP